MNDPYAVLGLSSNATDEQVRNAYRQLAGQYRQQIESGTDASAQQKMQMLDEAYDAIILSRSDSGSGGYYAGGAQSSFSDFSDVRMKIRDGRLDDAATILDGVPASQRNAEWHFLKGCVQQRKGWLEEASGNFAAATRMDPDNAEYRAAFNDVNNARSGGYRTVRQPSGRRGVSGCDVCSGLLCADCCCECMGGDLIRCCGGLPL